MNEKDSKAKRKFLSYTLAKLWFFSALKEFIWLQDTDGSHPISLCH